MLLNVGFVCACDGCHLNLSDTIALRACNFHLIIGRFERFDKLIETIAGVKVPGTGFGLGFDRTLEAADQFKLIPELTTSAQVLVTVFSLENSIAIAKKLREAAINTELYTDPAAKLDKQLKYADRKGIPYVVIQGSEEEKRRVVKLKNMKIKEQEDLSLDQVIQKLKAS